MTSMTRHSFKQCMALLLAILMTVSLSTVALAATGDDGHDPDYRDTSTFRRVTAAGVDEGVKGISVAYKGNKPEGYCTPDKVTDLEIFQDGQSLGSFTLTGTARRFYLSDIDETRFDFEFEGPGLDSDHFYEIEYNYNGVRRVPRASFGFFSRNFKNLPLGYSSIDRTENPIGINNRTDQNHYIISVEVTGDIELQNPVELPLEIAPGVFDTTSVVLLAKEDLSVGTHQGKLVIVSSDIPNPDASYQNKITFNKDISFKVIGGGGGGGDPTPNPGDDDNTSSPGDNVANTPATSDKLTEAVAAVKNLTDIKAGTLPQGVQLAQTAGGTAIAAVPLKLTNGSASLGLELLNNLGNAHGRVGLALTVAHSINDSVTVLLPGGFGAITEPGRFAYNMDYRPDAPNATDMLALVKGESANSSAIQVGGNFALPVAATITVKSSAQEGSTVNIYHYNPETGKTMLIGSAKVVGGKLTFATKQMGQLLLTSGRV